MPYKTDKIAIKDPFLTKSVRLLPCQKERVIDLYNIGYSINGLSRLFKVSKRLIQFIIFPDRKEKAKMLFAERQKTKRYYNKEKHKTATKKHRRYKKELFNP